MIFSSTRGLDSSTALEFIQALRIATDEVRLTTIVSLYQAGESLYECFNKVCVIYEGQMVYFGPAKEARQYFIDMGCALILSFLFTHTTCLQLSLLVMCPRIGKPPRTSLSQSPIRMLEFHGQVSHINRELLMNLRRISKGLCMANEMLLKSYYISRSPSETPKRNSLILKAPKRNFQDKVKVEGMSVFEVDWHVFLLTACLFLSFFSYSPYLLSLAQQVAIVMRRRVQILRGNTLATGLVLLYVAYTCVYPAYSQVFTSSFIFQAVIMGTVYLHTKEATSGYFSRGGVLFL